MLDTGTTSTIPRGTCIGDSVWKLSADLEIELEYGDKFVVATNSWIGEYGHGLTRQDAIDDLLTSLLDFRNSLHRIQEEKQLADELIETLSKLNLLLVKDN